MSRSPLLASSIVSSLLLIGLGRAQEAGAVPTPPSPAEILASAITKMTQLKSVAFRTTEAQNSAMGRRMQLQLGGVLGGGKGDVEIRGSWSNGLLRANLNDDEDQILVYQSRQIARNDDVSWKLRRNRLASGAPLPFVLDPERFFEALAALPKPARKVLDHSESTYRDTPVMILSLTLEDEDAQDFALSGALPGVQSGVAGIRIMGAGAGAGAAEMPELTVDLALYVDPTTGHVHKIRSRTYQKTTMGNVRLRIGGGAGGAAVEEEEEVKERDKDGKRIYQRGLPVRKLEDDVSRVEFDVVLTSHGDASTGKIDDVARRLLRLPLQTGSTEKK